MCLPILLLSLLHRTLDGSLVCLQAGGKHAGIVQARA
jgi:hypothetical protein